MEPVAPDRSGLDVRSSLNAKEVVKEAGTAPRSGTGFSFMARVVAGGEGGKWTLSAESRPAGLRISPRFTLSGPPSLKPGDLVRVFVDCSPDGAMSRRIGAANELLRAEALRSLGLPADSAVFALISAARVFGLRVDTQRIRQLHALVDRVSGKGNIEEEAAAAHAAALDDKGLPATEESIAAIAYASDPRSGSHGSDGRRRGRSRSRDLDAGAVREAVADFQESPSLLADFNAAAGRGGKRWMMFPLDFSGRSVELKASLRLLLNTETPNSKNRVEYCALDISSPSRYWSLEVIGGLGAARAVVRTDPPLGDRDGGVREALREALRPIACAVSFPEGVPARQPLDLDSLDPPSVREDA